MMSCSRSCMRWSRRRFSSISGCVIFSFSPPSSISTSHEALSAHCCAGLQVDLYRECPFWEENTLCMNKDCIIATVDEVCYPSLLPLLDQLTIVIDHSHCDTQSQIPEKWRAEALSKLELPPEEEVRGTPPYLSSKAPTCCSRADVCV